MAEGYWRLSVTDHFSSAHQLRHYQGKCEQLHGHNFQVEATIQGRRLDPKLGIVMDFKELKALLKQVLSELDHRNVNDHPAFLSENPSSENLARFIFKGLQAGLDLPGVRVRSVSVAEGPASIATYCEDE